MERIRFESINLSKGFSLISVRNLPVAAKDSLAVLNSLAERQINVLHIIQTTDKRGKLELTFSVYNYHLEDALKAIHLLSECHEKMIVEHWSDVARIEIEGIGFRTHPLFGVQLLSSLRKSGIQVLSVSTTETSMSLYVNEVHCKQAYKHISQCAPIESPLG